MDGREPSTTSSGKKKVAATVAQEVYLDLASVAPYLDGHSAVVMVGLAIILQLDTDTRRRLVDHAAIVHRGEATWASLLDLVRQVQDEAVGRAMMVSAVTGAEPQSTGQKEPRRKKGNRGA